MDGSQPPLIRSSGQHPLRAKQGSFGASTSPRQAPLPPLSLCSGSRFSSRDGIDCSDSTVRRSSPSPDQDQHELQCPFLSLNRLSKPASVRRRVCVCVCLLTRSPRSLRISTCEDIQSPVAESCFPQGVLASVVFLLHFHAESSLQDSLKMLVLGDSPIRPRMISVSGLLTIMVSYPEA